MDNINISTEYSSSEIEEELNLIFGASDANCCSYSMGAVKRQTLFICLTCCPEAKMEAEKSAAICLACALQCHGDHDMIKLYTKRNYRCDCPTMRIGRNICKLIGSLQEPFPSNVGNKYDQNFKGIFCNCQRPLPVLEGTAGVVILQCVICEDWYHANHLGLHSDDKNLTDNNVSEMICDSCMERFEFLNDYKHLQKVDDEEDDEQGSKRQKLECTRPKAPNKESKAVFWKDGWRLGLCKCTKCMEMYGSLGVQFLLDPEDTIDAYAERTILRELQESSSSRHQQILHAIANMDQVQKVKFIYEYNFRKDKLLEFLGNLESNNQIVTIEAIKIFFEQLRNDRRNREHN